MNCHHFRAIQADLARQSCHVAIASKKSYDFKMKCRMYRKQSAGLRISSDLI